MPKAIAKTAEKGKGIKRKVADPTYVPESPDSPVRSTTENWEVSPSPKRSKPSLSRTMKAAPKIPKRTLKPTLKPRNIKNILKAQQSSPKPEVDTTIDLDDDTPPALVVNIRQEKPEVEKTPEVQQKPEVVASTSSASTSQAAKRHTRDDLETMKTHLREKYCKDIDVLERSTAEDPEAWTKLDEITEELRNLRKLLNATENLVLSSGEDKENLDDNDEGLCNICMDNPIDCVILECGHMCACSKCAKSLKECPICRRKVARVVRTYTS